jgi:Na+-driven multidrug efflux pump
MTDVSRTETDDKKAEMNTPMLLNDSQVCPPDLSTWNTMGEISKYAAWPIVGMIFHPLYSVINAAVVGRMEKKYLAALGLGSLTTGICLISICSSFAFVLGSFVAPAHGRGDAKLARIYLHR